MPLARFARTGYLALDPKAWGAEFSTVTLAEPFETVGTVAVVTISGPLLQHRDPRWDSYDAILTRVVEALESPARTVVLRINSPGGDCSGCFEAARDLRAQAEVHGKRLVTYVDGQCSSAAYALGCAADLVVSPATNKVGSIGCYEALLDVTAQDAAQGIRLTFVSSGARKLDGNPHVPTSTEAVAAVGGQIEILSEMFFTLVSEMRSIPADDVRAMEGQEFLGTQALDNSLVDALDTWAGLLAALQAPEGTMAFQAKAKDDKPDEGKGGMAEALNALNAIALAEEDSEPRKAARRALKAFYADEAPEEKPKEEEAKAARAEDTPEDEDKKDDDKKEPTARAALASASSSSNEVALAARVHALEAARAQEKDQEARAQLLARRPDFSAEVRQTLATASLATLRTAVETWPRITASPQAAANAVTTPVTGGERPDDSTPSLTPEQRVLMDTIQGKDPRMAKAMVIRGNETSVPIYDRATARARLVQLSAAAKEIR